MVIENTLNNIDEDGAAGESEHHRFWVLCSLIADGVFFLAANRVDNRFVQGMVGTYEQRIGYAFYLHVMGTVCWMIAFICAITTTYKFINVRDSRGSKENLFTWQSQRAATHNVIIQGPILSYYRKVKDVHTMILASRSSHELRVPREEPLLSKYPPSSSQAYRPSPQPAFRPSPIMPNYRETSA
ncbi:Clc-like protein [Ostertagia ostertagi]